MSKLTMKKPTSGAEEAWWRTSVIYEIYPRSFADTTGNGVGDLQGITRRLAYVGEILGADAVWIAPFYPSPMADFGYDVADYTDVDPLFGTLEDFDHLVEEAHQRGLRVIIDFVPNHTSDQHPWFQASRSAQDSPKRDWYIWADPASENPRTPPNNWLSVFGGPAWTWDETTGQYYMHSFLEEQPDLNWRNPEVRDAMFDQMRFWLERGVDGFRLDVINYLIKDAELRDDPPGPSPSPWDSGEYATLTHRYSKDRPEVFEIVQTMRDLTDKYGARILIGEVYHPDVEFWARFYGDAPGEGLHLPFNFRLMLAEWTAPAIRAEVERVERAVPAWGWINNVLGSHDVSRVASRVGRRQARVAAMLLLTLRGTPTLYYGDEIGMTDVAIPSNRVQDPYGQRVAGSGRDPCRTAMQWSAGLNAGFSPAETEELWLPLAETYESVNVAEQLDDPASSLTLYRRLLSYRRATPALQHGGYDSVGDTPPACYVYWRRPPSGEDGRHVLVALNFSDQEEHLSLSSPGKGVVMMSTHLDRSGDVDWSDIVLRGDEGIIIEVESGL